MVVIWVVAAAVMLGIEVFATAFYAVFVAAGLVSAAIADALGAPLWLQLVLIGGVSMVGVGVARPPLIRMMERRRPDITLPGVQNIVGQRAMTVDEVGDEHHPGHALLA